MDKQTFLKNIIHENGGCLSTSSLSDSYEFCKKKSKEHYENFPVGSVLIPSKIRKHFYAVYSYSRIADDIGDEYIADSKMKINALEKFKSYLEKDYSNSDKKHPVFFALQNTIKEKNLRVKPFQNLIIAFQMDSEFKPFDSLKKLFNYCTFSANPVGEIVLGLFNEASKENIQYSDAICTALQMTNFWQDISIDKNINRCYIPKDILKAYSIPLECFTSANIVFPNSSYFVKCMDYLFNETQKLFNYGKKLLPNLNSFRLKLEISAIISAGETILDKCRKNKTDLFTFRPKLNAFDKVTILVKAVGNIL